MTSFSEDHPSCSACGHRTVCLFATIASSGIATHYQAGTEIIRKFTPNTGVHVVCKGMVALSEAATAQKNSILNLVPDGGILGIVECCLGLRRYHFSARTLTDSIVTFFPLNDVQRFLADHSGDTKILAEVCRALRQLERRYILRDAAEVSDRLIATLLWLSEMDETASLQQATIPFELTNAMLSSLIGARPETVTRLMSQLQTAQLITYSEGRIVVADRENLRGRSSLDPSRMLIDPIMS